MSSITGGGATINGDSITGGGSVQDLSVSNLTITNKGLIQREINQFTNPKEIVSKEYVDSTSGGNPFNQDLNTFDSPQFEELAVKDSTAVNPDNVILKKDRIEFRGDPINTSLGSLSYQDGAIYKVISMGVNKGDFPTASQARIVVDGQTYIFQESSLSMNNARIANLANPLVDQDATTKVYVDSSVEQALIDPVINSSITLENQTTPNTLVLASVGGVNENRIESNGSLEINGSNLTMNLTGGNLTQNVGLNKVEIITGIHSSTATSHTFNGALTASTSVTTPLLSGISTITNGSNININNLGGNLIISNDEVIINSAGGIDLTGAAFGISLGANQITTTKTTFLDNELVTKLYVDDTHTLQSAYDNGNSITTALALPVNIIGDLATTNLQCDNINSVNQQMTITSNKTENIAANYTSTIGANKIETINAAHQQTIIGSNTITAASHLITGNTNINGVFGVGVGPCYEISDSAGQGPCEISYPSELNEVGGGDKSIVLEATAGSPATRNTNVNFTVQTAGNLPVNPSFVISGTNGQVECNLPLALQGNAATTTKTVFNDSQEFVSKAYVDATSTSQPNQSITWSLQGILDNYDTTTSITTIPLSSVVNGNLSINYPGVGALQELNPTVRTGNILTVPATAWYSIRMTYSHPSLPIIGTNAQAGLGSDCKIYIKINGSPRIPLGQEDSGAGITESISTVIDRYLTANSTIEWEWEFGAAQTNEDFFINCSVINQTKSITLSNFTGATPSLNGVEGLVPAPSAGQEFATLLGSGSFLNLSAPAIIDMYGQEILDWTGRISPGLVGLNFAGSTSYQTNSNNYFLNIVNAGSQVGYINFDALQSYDKFKFEVYYKILNTTQPADILGFFGCGSQLNTGNENNTGGLTFDTDYFNGGSYNAQGRISDGTGAIITPYQLRGYSDITGTSYFKMTMTRFGQNITIDIEGDGGKYSLTSFNFIPTFTGSRFGIIARTGGSSMNIEINSIKLIAF